MHSPTGEARLMTVWLFALRFANVIFVRASDPTLPNVCLTDGGYDGSR